MAAAAARDALADLEARLDPARPEAAGVRVLAYGEISAALVVDDPALTGVVAKRMAGFRSDEQVRRYLSLLTEYLSRLSGEGVVVLPTQAESVARPGAPPVVYLLQPLVEPESLGHHILVTAGDDELEATISAVLSALGRLLDRNGEHPEDQISVDAQLSNWSFATAQDPVLLDVGTPFIRRHGRHSFDAEIVLAAVPPLLRAYYRWRVADSYMDDYFAARSLCLDLLGNFAKEGAGERTGVGLGVVNAWLAARGERQVSERDVADYYRSDAATLELFLKVRRADRSVRGLLHQRYDFILPGPVRR